MPSECDEIAESIWRARSVEVGNGLNATLPIRCYEHAEWTARFYLRDQSATIIANVAEALYRMAKASKSA